MGRDVLWFKRLISEQGVRKAKQEIDRISKLKPILVVDYKRLRPKLRNLVQLINEKEHLEHERTAYIELLELRADLKARLQKLSRRTAAMLRRSKTHLRSREDIKAELAKLRSQEHYLEFILGYLNATLKREHAPAELASKLLEVDSEIIELGGTKLLMAIEDALKKKAIRKTDLSELAKLIK